MSKEIIVSRNGTARAIHSPETDSILRALGGKNGVQLRRASHVEPTPELSDAAAIEIAKSGYVATFKNLFVAITSSLPADDLKLLAKDIRDVLPQDVWWADMLPVDGPVLGPFTGPNAKQAALDAEVAYLQAHNIPVCNACRESPTDLSPFDVRSQTRRYSSASPPAEVPPVEDSTRGS